MRTYLHLGAGGSHTDVLAVSGPRHAGHIVILRRALHELQRHSACHVFGKMTQCPAWKYHTTARDSIAQDAQL